MSEVQSFLKSVNFKDLENWSVQYLLETSFSYNESYPLVKIGSFLTRNKTQIIVQDDVEYKRVTIKINNGGIFLRDKKIGKDIGTKKQFIIKKGQFLLSKIDARNGAFGVVTDEVDEAIITGNFWTFDVNYTQINPHFLSLITTTKEFIRFCANASNGTTNRHYLQEEAFLNVKIPLPSPQQQEEILKKYNDKIELAKQQEEEAKEIEDSIEKYLFEELGIEKIEIKKEKSGLQFVEFKDIIEWNLNKILKTLSIKSLKYKMYKFQDVCTLITDGTHQTPTYTTKEDGIIFLSSKDVTTKEINWNKIKYIPKELHQKLTQRVKPKIFDILLAKNGTTGVAAILDIEKEFSIYVSLALLRPIQNLINPYYLLYYINSSISKKQFNEKLVGVGVPNLHLSKIRETLIALPPLNIQEKIANEITKRKEKIKQLKQKAQKNREEAIKEFEREIFDEN